MFRNRVIALAALALAGIIATGWISDRATRVMAESVAALNHTRDVLVRIDQLVTVLAEVESQARAFAITREPRFLKGFQNAAPAVRPNAARVVMLASADPRAHEDVTRLPALVERRMALLSELTSLVQRQAPHSAITTCVIAGSDVTHQIRAAVNDVRVHELEQLHARADAARRAERFAAWAPWAMCSIAVIMFGLMLHQAALAAREETRTRSMLASALKDADTAREHAVEADRAKDQFIAMVSHELRTPLTSIIGWCGILRKPESRETIVDEGIAHISNAARVQSQLIEDLLDASRIAAGSLEICLSPVDLCRVVDSAIASVAPAARTKAIVITPSGEPGPLMMLADGTRLQQVVGNLVSNAVKFTPDGGGVEVSLRQGESHVELAVRDNGEGIGPDLLKHVFDRFRQGTRSRNREAGLGLGLSIVKTLVELHGGTVRAESEGNGKGSTFTVTLPLKVVAAPAELSSPAPESARTIVA